MVYDNHRFFQWIEGLRTALDHIMHSRRHDERHTNVEVLGSEQIFSRTFDGWSMKTAAPGPVLASWRRDMIDPRREIMESLRGRLKVDIAAAEVGADFALTTASDVRHPY